MMMPMGIIEGKLAFSIAKSRPVACITVVMRTLDIAQFYLKKNGQDGCGVGARDAVRAASLERVASKELIFLMRLSLSHEKIA